MERQTAARIRPPCMHDHRIPANRVIQDFGSLTDDEVRTRMCLFSRSWTVVMSICGERMSVYREGMSVCSKGTFEWTKGMSVCPKRLPDAEMRFLLPQRNITLSRTRCRKATDKLPLSKRDIPLSHSNILLPQTDIPLR